MIWIPGFNVQILEALKSEDPKVLVHAIEAAGAREMDAAWPYVSAIIMLHNPDKNLLLAAIEASVDIRPEEAGTILVDLSESDDEDIADFTILSAIAVAPSKSLLVFSTGFSTGQSIRWRSPGTFLGFKEEATFS